MQENTEQKSVSNGKSSKNNKDEVKRGFFAEHKAEFKKITWPTKQVLAKQTFTVIVISMIVGLIIFLYDLGIGFVFESVIKLING